MNQVNQTNVKPGLRLMVYDRTDTGPWYRPGLTHAWWAGARLYSALSRLDGYVGVESWDDALRWLATVQPGEWIAEVQYWGHGKWGEARANAQRLNEAALGREHAFRADLDRVAARLSRDSLWWFRTCETFGARPGQSFARAFADRLGCRVAGHTYIIGHVQSGLHSLQPGQTPTWPDDEGLREGTPEAPKRAYWSSLREPNTITLIDSAIPTGY